MRKAKNLKTSNPTVIEQSKKFEILSSKQDSYVINDIKKTEEKDSHRDTEDDKWGQNNNDIKSHL